MKKVLTFAVLLSLSAALHAQKDVTRFLGIPVDGSKPEMIQKLKEKGFTASPDDRDVLTGEFNGTEVEVHVVTNNNKVYRVMLRDAIGRNETDIKIRFNNLCQQFLDNPKYLSPMPDMMIPDDEDISFQMSVNNKRYEAAFRQKPEDNDSVMTANEMRSFLLTKFTQEQIDKAEQSDDL